MSPSVLESLLARQEAAEAEALIRRTVALYGMLLDDRRFDEWSQLFTEDAVWEIPGVSFAGRAEILAGVAAMEPAEPGWVKHLSYPSVVQIDCPTSASAWTDLVAMSRDARGTWAVAAVGRYHDEFRKQGGAWRFHRRRADIDTAAVPLPDLPSAPRL